MVLFLSSLPLSQSGDPESSYVNVGDDDDASPLVAARPKSPKRKAGATSSSDAVPLLGGDDEGGASHTIDYDDGTWHLVRRDDGTPPYWHNRTTKVSQWEPPPHILRSGMLDGD